jgi:hypothetical protein
MHINTWEGNSLISHIPQSLLICFKSVLQNIDDVVHLAIAKKVLKKTVEDVDEKFKKAIDKLSTYEKSIIPIPRNLSSKG